MNWHTFFIYEDALGDLIWKALPETMFRSPKDADTWNRKYAGKFVYGQYDPKHNVNARVQFGRLFSPKIPSAYKHRIIYEMHYGPIPDGMFVDHKDRNPANNRLDNLRLATKSQNCSNTKLYRTNTTGVRGVCWHKRDEMFRATIRVNKTRINLGAFKELKDAANAYREAQARYHADYAGQTE